MRPSALLCLAALCSSSACAQTNALFFSFPNGNVYDGGAPLKVEVWASYVKPQYFAWALWSGAVNGDVSGEFSNPVLANWAPPPGTSPGIPGSGGVSSIVAGQLWFGNLFFPDTSNPIRLWSAEWSTDNLQTRTVAITTWTTNYGLYNPNMTTATVIASEASGLIQVVPAPAAFALSFVFAPFLRRHR